MDVTSLTFGANWQSTVWRPQVSAQGQGPALCIRTTYVVLDLYIVQLSYKVTTLIYQLVLLSDCLQLYYLKRIQRPPLLHTLRASALTGIMSLSAPLTTAIPSPTLSLNFTDPLPKIPSQNPVHAAVATPPHPDPAGSRPQTARTLQETAARARALVDGFLQQTPESPDVATTQDQVRISLRVIQEALIRYGSVLPINA